MSGHNPHGYLGQQINQTWNHLQVPAFIPRQPQLAHMSNERPIRTPLSWPTPAHSAELYGYMSAAAAAASNHKSVSISELCMIRWMIDIKSRGFSEKN